MNPRYEAYLKTTDTPTNYGFIEFISDMVTRYKTSKGQHQNAPIENQDEFTRFIECSI